MTHQKLTMAPRQAVTKANAQCKRADKAGEGLILDEWCATTDWPRNDARKALTGALTPRLVRPWAPRRPIPQRGNYCRAGLRLGGTGRPDGEAASLDHGRVGAQAATFPGAGDHRRRRAGVAGDVGCHDGPLARADRAKLLVRGR